MITINELSNSNLISVNFLNNLILQNFYNLKIIFLILKIKISFIKFNFIATIRNV